MSNAPSNEDWAKAIAMRIVDEHTIKDGFPDQAQEIQTVFEKLFSENAWAVEALVGSGMIEEDYFDPLN
jgi:hypothetical protein